MDFPADAKQAHALLRRLAEGLETEETREAALVELNALAARAKEEKAEGSPLVLQEVELGIGARQERLRLLLLPSIFAPESWAYTFLEGLLRVPQEEFEGKSLVEVGTGSGWICVALAKLTGLKRIQGVDLNPQSRAVATCNLWLNCHRDEAERVSFFQGDLLRDFPEENRWDFIVGCIPQVLRTEGVVFDEDADESSLYDLSNYCAMQNVYEDHFGLGLIAKLLDESPERLSPGGKLYLNLAGRPGRTIIERMFSRRGFSTSVKVARRVEQASDTDIAPLVSLEEKTRSEFEFFLAKHSPEPIRAKTALGWLSAGHPIWHEVAVWEAWLRHPHTTLALRRGLRRAGVGRLLQDLDLGEASEEQLGFVASLAERLAKVSLLPYPHEAGDLTFRRQVSRYLARYFGLHLDAGEIFVGPEREQTVHSLLLATCDRGDRILVTRNIYDTYEKTFANAEVKVTVTNNTLREVRGLLGVFDPKVVFISVSPQERADFSALMEIVDDAADRGIRVVVDESAYFNITSGVESRTLFELLAKERHRPNLVVLYGLIKNAVYPDFELTFLLPVGEQLFADLEVAAEVTYSRISTLVQWFYEYLFADLLRFQISFAATPTPGDRTQPPAPLSRSERMNALSSSEAFAPKIFEEDDPRLIRLDYGENEDRVPFALLEGILGASLAPEDAGPFLKEGIAAFLLETRGVRYDPEEIVTGQGVWPLIHDAAVALRESLGRAPKVFVAAPCYGLLPPTLLAAGCEVETGPLAIISERSPPDAIVISQPANPEGCFLSREELQGLVSFSREHGAWLFSDEIFGLLSLEDPKAATVPSPVTLDPLAACRTVVFGGLSKEFAAGGLRVGWAAAKDVGFMRRMEEASLGPLHRSTARAASHVYGAWLRDGEGNLFHPKRRAALDGYLESLRRSLAAKRDRLAAAFGGDEIRDPGGLFIAPKVDSWLGKKIDGETITPENLPRILYRETGVVVNGGPWCQDQERIRAVYSIPREQVEEAAKRIKDFADRLLSESAWP